MPARTEIKSKELQKGIEKEALKKEVNSSTNGDGNGILNGDAIKGYNMWRNMINLWSPWKREFNATVGTYMDTMLGINGKGNNHNGSSHSETEKSVEKPKTIFKAPAKTA